MSKSNTNPNFKFNADATIARAEREFKILSEYYNQNKRPELDEQAGYLLDSITSISEHLGHDFDRLFGLGIGEDENHFWSEFEDKSKGNKSKDFFDASNNIRKTINNHPILSKLKIKRNKKSHVKLISVDLTKIGIVNTITTSVFVGVGDTPEEAKRDVESQQSESQLKKPRSYSTVDYGFSDIPDLSVLEVTEMYLDFMKDWVKYAKNRFT